MIAVRIAARFPWLHRLVHRDPAKSCLICAAVWRSLEREPGFNERMREAEEDLAAGRFVRFDPRDA